MYAYSGDTNDKEQFLYYGKRRAASSPAAGACSMDNLYALQHIGYMISPQPERLDRRHRARPYYGDRIEGSDVPVGYDSDCTNRNTTVPGLKLDAHNTDAQRQRGHSGHRQPGQCLA